MITYIHNESKRIDDETYIWFIGNCLSTDFKPVDKVYEASKLFELDTLKTYIYDSATHTWQQVSCGGGSGSSGVLMIHQTAGVLDKTWREIHDALLESPVFLVISNGDSVTCCPVLGTDHDSEAYYVYVQGSMMAGTFSASTEDGYPSQNSGPTPK